MTLVVEKFRLLLPPRIKSSPSGWASFNAPCCHHRGHTADTRKRAGIRFERNGIIYNCFNCKFSTGWQPGSAIGEKLKTLCRWMGASEDTIKELIFEAIKTEGEGYQPRPLTAELTFVDKALPPQAVGLQHWLDADLTDQQQHSLAAAIAYVIDRGQDPFDQHFMWTPAVGYEDRIIIPFAWQQRIVGHTARKITSGRPKYVSDQPPHFVFNFDSQHNNQKYILVCEGPFDAIAVNGVALLTNEIAEQQARIINSLGAQVIVIPDQDSAGLTLFDRAAELNWSIAMPNWHSDVKDAADAVKKYGALFVIVDAIKTAQQGQIKIAMAKKQQEHKLQRLEHV